MNPWPDDLYYQLCDERGEFVEGKVPVQQMLEEGILHAAAHVWLYKKEADQLWVLLQKRSETKATYPGMYDVSAGGHCNYGEDIQTAAIREAREEINFEIDIDTLHLMFVHRVTMQVPQMDYIENEFRWVYAYQYEAGAMSADMDEVVELKWVTIDEFVRMVDNPSNANMVDHGHDYFSMLLEYLRTV